MNANYVVYNTAGRIVRYGACPANVVEYQAVIDGNYVLDAACDDDRRQYVDTINLVVADKAAITPIIDKPTIVADDIDEALVTGLPTICTVYHDGQEIAVDDGGFIFTADQPGEYIFTIDEAAYLETRFTINAS